MENIIKTIVDGEGKEYSIMDTSALKLKFSLIPNPEYTPESKEDETKVVIENDEYNNWEDVFNALLEAEEEDREIKIKVNYELGEMIGSLFVSSYFHQKEENGDETFLFNQSILDGNSLVVYIEKYRDKDEGMTYSGGVEFVYNDEDEDDK